MSTSHSRGTAALLLGDAHSEFDSVGIEHRGGVFRLDVQRFRISEDVTAQRLYCSLDEGFSAGL
jgi:hypothetical protein